MVVTAPVCQLEMSPLKAVAPRNTVKKKVVREETVFKRHYNLLAVMSVTWEVCQLEMSWLKALAP